MDEAIAIIQEGGNLLANTHKAFINGQWADAADGKTMDAGRDFRSGGGVVPLHDHRRCHPDGKDTPYGLSASIWIGNGTRGLALAGRIKAGTVWINEHLIIFCDTSWGGCKESGWGKDLSKMVLEEYTLTKHIYLDLTEEVEKPW